MSGRTPDQIAALLAQAIRERVFAPGAPLIQEDLALRFQVSRSPVREALRILAAQGVVTMPPGGAGATVRVLSLADLDELYDLRLVLEPEIAPHIVAGALPRHLASLRRHTDAMRSATDIGSWMRSNYTFHCELYAIADRPRTETVLRDLLSAVQPYSQQNVDQLGGRRQADDEHLAMIDATRSRDADALADLFRSHLTAARNRLHEEFAARAVEEDPLSSLR